MSHTIDTKTLMKNRSFERVFEVQPLTGEESREIELLLVENFQPTRITEEQVGQDYSEICRITAEIRAINKQQVVLIGERIFKARELFKNYGDGSNTFTQWIEKIFGSKRTAYNMLSYFEFYEQLPLDMRSQFKQLPLKAAYCLSNRQASMEAKLNIIRAYEGQKPDDVIMLIQAQLPAAEGDGRRRSGNQMMLTKMRDLCKTLQVRKEHLSDKERRELEEIFSNLKKVLN
ncbi:MAG: CT583 family protein [Simkaniaceae bacterium]|nr:CT583 family protein [Simkaniaceae bacterium]